MTSHPGVGMANTHAVILVFGWPGPEETDPERGERGFADWKRN